MGNGRVILGAMSGTSADGVDVAVTRVYGRGLRMRAELICLTSSVFAPSLRRAIVDARGEGAVSLRALAQLGRDLTLAYARTARAAMRKARIEPSEVACIAAHGQTLFHDPPLTIQWFDPSPCALETGCPVVSDFRRADCALGGQGAPLVPFADYLMFRDSRRSRVLLNIGGIANITYLPAGGSLADIIAFDTGPGNCLSDHIAGQRLKVNCDRGGSRAIKGMPVPQIVERFLKHRYFRQGYPKSTDGPAMLDAFGEHPRVPTNDLLATACLCCARTIARSLKLLPGNVDEIIAAGGGMNNRAIVRMLAEETGLPIRSTDDFGIPIAAREAMAFALLGAATLDGICSNVPSVTGASHPTILGSITPRPV